MSTADLGADAAVECARYIDSAHGKRNAVLLEIIALAGQRRRSNSELLRLYDPAAWRLFYTNAGVNDQQLIAKALALEIWPVKLPEAMVRAAPLPTMQWMQEQAKSEHPRLAELIRIWQTWGFWARVGHERQYLLELPAIIGKLAVNRTILADSTASAALLRFAGETRAMTATGFIVDSLAHAAPIVRAQAAVACGHLVSEGSGPCRQSDTRRRGPVCGRVISETLAAAILRAAKGEQDPVVQQKIAMAAEAWPDRADIGAAMLGLFNRTASATVRREILFSCADTTWPSRADLLLRAFDVPGDGVLGAALTALAVRTEPKALDKTLELARQTAEAQPPLIDALAAYGDGRAMRHLIRWLSKQDNPVVRVKLLLALERTSNHEADALLLQLLNGDSSAMVVEQTIGIIARKQIAGSEEVLIGLAVDKTAPMQLRVQAIWAMGRFDTPEIRKTLDDLDTHPERFFKAPIDEHGNPAFSETIDMARMMVALAKIQLHAPDGDAKLQAAYDRGTATSQLTALVMLAQTGHDHPIISQGLAATETAVIFGAVRAARAANPKKYHDRLAALRHAPFIEALLASGLDSANLRPTLDAAIEAGKSHE
jgi:HEAT repeat protein